MHATLSLLHSSPRDAGESITAIVVVNEREARPKCHVCHFRLPTTPSLLPALGHDKDGKRQHESPPCILPHPHLFLLVRGGDWGDSTFSRVRAIVLAEESKSCIAAEQDGVGPDKSRFDTLHAIAGLTAHREGSRRSTATCSSNDGDLGERAVACI